MATGDDMDTQSFELPLPAYHDESHPLHLATEVLRAQADFEDPAERLTVCELPRKSQMPLR